MSNITVIMKGGSICKFRHEGRPGGSYIADVEEISETPHYC
jgi:hypothetical protein